MKFWEAMKIVDEGGKVRRRNSIYIGYVAKSIKLRFEGFGLSLFDDEGKENYYEIRVGGNFPDCGNWYDFFATDWEEVVEPVIQPSELKAYWENIDGF